MTQEIENKLEQAARNSAAGGALMISVFKRGAQTILDNPKEWGLMPILESMQHIEESDQNWSDVVNDLKSQLAKYREALESIIEYWNQDRNDEAMHSACWHAYYTADEALKNIEK